MQVGIDSPPSDMPAEQMPLSGKHLLTHCSADVLRMDRIGEVCAVKGTKPRFIIIVADPRSLLSQVAPDLPHQHEMSWDHMIERNANNYPSFTAPGLEPCSFAATTAFEDEDLETLIIRCEDLRSNPEREWVRIEAFTGLQFSNGDKKLDGLAKLKEGLSKLPALADPEIDLKRYYQVAAYTPSLRIFMKRFGYGNFKWWTKEMEPNIQPKGLQAPRGMVVGYFTEGSLYEREARRMEYSARQLGISIHLEPVPDRGSWLANVRAKPAILTALRNRFDGPLLYVDVDAIFHQDPWPYLDFHPQDVAYCTMRDGLARSGTILIKDTTGARNFLAEWQRRLDANPADWDQAPLTAMLIDSGKSPTVEYTIGLLPVSLCCVFDRSPELLSDPLPDAIIEHLQASREQAERLINVHRHKSLERRQARIAEIEQGMRDLN